MGNIHKSSKTVRSPQTIEDSEEFVSVNEFLFHDAFKQDDTSNGLYFNGIYVPEEVLQKIFSHVPPTNLLELTLVCKRWCNIIKSENLWMDIYNRFYPNKAKKLPWYIFYCYFTTNYFDNMLKNGNGQEQFKHWKLVKNGHEFRIENPPIGCVPLPRDVPDFNGRTGCFVTSYYESNKIQEISLLKKRLLRYILNKFMPHIYVSEWVAGRFDCGSMYKLGIRGYGKEYTKDMSLDDIAESPNDTSIMPLFYMTKKIVIQQWEGKLWEKVEILVEEYPRNVTTFIFEHEGHDTQFWKGHYGSKMAGGVVKIVFDSIEPLGDRDEARRQLYQNIDMSLLYNVHQQLENDYPYAINKFCCKIIYNP